MKQKRMYAALLAALMTLTAGASGCGFVKEDGATLEMSMENSWHTEKTLQSVSHDPLLGVGMHLLCFKVLQPGNSEEYLWYDTQTGEKTRFVPKCMENIDPLERVSSCPIELPDGNIGIVCTVYQNKGGGEFDVHERCMEVYDTEMNYLETREMPAEIYDGKFFYTQRHCMDAQGNWYSISDDMDTNETSLIAYNSEYEAYGEIDLPYLDDHAPTLFNGADGTVYVRFSLYDQDWNQYEKIYKLDAQTRTYEELGATIPDEVRWTMPGTGEYDFYYSTPSGIYGVKGDTFTELIDCINSDFPSGSLHNFYPLDDGTFVLYSSADSNNWTYWLARPRTQEEIDSTKLISLATAQPLTDELAAAVINYNRAENGYRIMIKDYGEYNTIENPELGYETMKQDMLDGIVADMICTDGLNFESLAGKGLFADWYDLMDADEEFDRDAYLPNFFEAYETNGALRRLGVTFTISTALAKTEFAGEEVGQSLGTILNTPLPEGMHRFDYSPVEYMAQMWMYNLQTGCIDRKTAQCCFDSPEFVQFLELLCSIPQEEVFYDSEYVTTAEDTWKNDGIYLRTCTIAQPIDLHAEQRATFFDADITLVGYPMVEDEGNGGIFDAPFTVSMNAQSREQDAIWDFMKHLLSEEYQKQRYDSMPIHTGALEHKLDEAEHMVTATVGIFPSTVQIGAMEEWETERLRDYIYGIKTCWYYDQKVYNILMEETEKMLAGDQTPQEAAQVMQSRVTIYLSEQS